MRIKLLAPQLANQIAAGEVVERPASVVKELVENSLDAGATRVDIDIEKGGSKLIRIRDNGQGIDKEELALALSRHATSKVETLDDLEAILSFGFRGEALASISSVSRLTLTSKPEAQEQGWQAYAEGSQMDVKVQPAAHPNGTTIEAVDLFFNTPARRRFLKSDKTEFTHIDEWLKRIAAVRRDIHFTLSHNGKLVRQYRPATTQVQYIQRLGQICGRQFAENALEVTCEHDGLSLSGYLQSPRDSVVSDSHYFYVNGRLVRDRLVNHAVKQAFAEQGVEFLPGFVLMLDLDPHQVDVNVHPAKHEVRFHQARFVHDFILQALQSALSQMQTLPIAKKTIDNDVLVDNETGEIQAQNNAEGFELTSLTSNALPSYQESHLNKQGEEQPSRHNSISPFGKMTIPTSPKGHTSHSLSGYSSSKPTGYDTRQQERPSPSYQVSIGAAKPKTGSPSKTAVDSYGQLLQLDDAINGVNSHAQSVKMPLLLNGEYWVVTDALLLGADDGSNATLRLLPLALVNQAVIKLKVIKSLSTGLIGQPLLMPVSIKSDEGWPQLIEDNDVLIRKLGLELTFRFKQLIIKKVPTYLRESQLTTLIPEFLQWISHQTPNDEALAAWVAQKSRTQSYSEATLWQQFCLLDEDNKRLIMTKAHELPWQTWLENKK